MTDSKKAKKGAVALQYDGDRDGAPKVSATGKGETAERILAEAKKHDIPVREDPDLLEVLSQIPLGEEIPPELYQAVAEILAFVYRVNERYGSG